jgi:hypothetical protein
MRGRIIKSGINEYLTFSQEKWHDLTNNYNKKSISAIGSLTLFENREKCQKNST